MCPVNDAAAHVSAVGAVETARATSPPAHDHRRAGDRVGVWADGVRTQATPYAASAAQQPTMNVPCAIGLV
jgi:hypothetical protein